MFAGHLVFAFTQWLQLSVITKYCSAFEIGLYTLALAIISPLFILAGLQLKAIQITDSRGEWKFSEFFTLRMVCMLLALVFVLIYSLCISLQSLLFFVLVTVLKGIEGFSEILNGQQQLHEQMKQVAISNILRGGTAFAGLLAGILYTHSIYTGLLIAVVANLLVLVLYDYPNCKKLITGKLLSITDTRYQKLILKSLPLAMVVTLIYLNSNVSKYFIEYTDGTEMQGVYSTVSYLIVLGNLVNNALGQALTPRLSKLYSEGAFKLFKKFANGFIALNVVMGLGIVGFVALWGKYLLLIFFNPAIASYTYLFVLIMIAGVFLYTVSSIGYVLTCMQVLKYQPIIHSAGFVTNVIACFFLVGRYHLEGAAYAWIISFMIQLVLSVLILQVAYRRRITYKAIPHA